MLDPAEKVWGSFCPLVVEEEARACNWGLGLKIWGRTWSFCVRMEVEFGRCAALERLHLCMEPQLCF